MARFQKKAPPAPLVTSVSTKLSKTIQTLDTQAATPEETKKRKKSLLEIVDSSVELFRKNLEEGKVEMISSVDLERLVKLSMLLSGEPDSVTGKPLGQEDQETTQNISYNMSKIEEILDDDDPQIQDLYKKLFMGYNEANDIK